MPIKTLVTINNVINGQANLQYASTPIFTYNTVDPYSAAYVPNVSVAGLVTAQCQPPTTGVNSQGFTVLLNANCPADMVESVGVDLETRVTASAVQENYFVVFRLSSTSYLYSPVVG
jgi:hypothetical protein